MKTMQEIADTNQQINEVQSYDDVIKKLNDIADDVNKAGRGLNLTVDVTDDGLIKLSKDWDKVKPTKAQYNKMVKEYGQNFADEVAADVDSENDDKKQQLLIAVDELEDEFQGLGYSFDQDIYGKTRFLYILKKKEYKKYDA